MDSSVKDICTSGDLILDVVPTEQKYMLRLSSHALCLASPVFKAMLNSNFLEGISKFASGERRIRLPNDDYDIVKTFCDIIHFQGIAIQFPTLDNFEEMGIFCDKYGATDAAML